MEKRIKNEVKNSIANRESWLKQGIDLQLVKRENLMNWVLYLKFVERDSLYFDQTYQVDIVLPSEYPLKPPKCRFVTPIFHPNIKSSDGEICLNVLKEDTAEWTPALSLFSIGLALQSLVNGPNCDSPLNLDAGGIFRSGDTRAYKSLIDYYYYRNQKK